MILSNAQHYIGDMSLQVLRRPDNKKLIVVQRLDKYLFDSNQQIIRVLMSGAFT